MSNKIHYLGHAVGSSMRSHVACNAYGLLSITTSKADITCRKCLSVVEKNTDNAEKGRKFLLYTFPTVRFPW